MVQSLERSENTLILSPHPDDEVLGCGGIIKKITTSGDKVYILIVTRGKKGVYSEDRVSRVRMEALNAHEILGVSETRFLDFPAPDLDTIPAAYIAEEINKVLRELNISTLFLPHRGDIHHDHRVVFNAGLVAARPVRECPVKRIFSYETLSETEWAAPFSDDSFIPDYFVNIDNSVSFKLQAMQCFISQLRDFPNPRSLKTIETLANFRGSTVGFTHAEAFMTIRIIQE